MDKDIFICVDCYFEYYGNDNIFIDMRRVEKIKGNVAVLKKYYTENILDEELSGYKQMSVFSCGCCGSRQFGTRYRFSLTEVKKNGII